MAKYELYIGSFKNGDTALLKGIFDSAIGSVTLTDRLPMVRPSFLALSEDKNTLFAIREAKKIGEEYGGGVASVDVSGEKMKVLSEQSIHAAGPSHLCLQDGRLIVSVYGEGGLAQFPVEKERYLAPINRYIQHFGTGPNAKRQECPHPHFVKRTPDGDYIALCDLGLDKIMMYPYSEEKGLALEAKEVDAPKGSGPRHLVFSADGSIMYVLTEMGNSVLVYDYHGDGTATLRQEISMLPFGYDKDSTTAAAIRINAAETELIASNRGHDSLVFYRILPDHTLKLEGFLPTQKWPRDFALTPDGHWLLCANQDSDTICVYSYGDNLSLPLGMRVIPQPQLTLNVDTMPCCLIFGKEIAE